MQRGGLSQSKNGLVVYTKDLWDCALLASFNFTVEIDKVPAQAAAEFLTDRVLPGPHESYKKHRPRSHGTPQSEVTAAMLVAPLKICQSHLVIA